MKVGDRVKYGVLFLRSIACYSGALPHARGTVVSRGNLGIRSATVDADPCGLFVVVKWENDYMHEVPTLINRNNLVLASDSEMHHA